MEEAIDNIWHVYSDGVRADIPFDREEDKVFGWNSVAVCAEICGVRVWVVTVNDTHLHVLACCDGSRAERFKCLLQQRLQRHFPGENIHLACDPVTKREDVLSKFMYVYRNCLDFYRKLPGEYPWGCGHLYFSEKRNFYRGRRVDWLSGREQYRMFRTKHPIPQHWRFEENGRILPESFVDFEAVELFFRSVRTFIAFLYVRKEDEAAMKQEIYRNYMESRSIQELRKIGNRYCVNYCGRTLPKTTLEIRLKVALRLLREGISGKSASLAKALYLKPDDIRLLV